MVINVTVAAKEKEIAPVWRMPFRPFFSAIAIYSCIALALWLFSLFTGASIGQVGYLWHLHEMIMGFAATTVVGFVLTASQTWTGVRTLHGTKLAALFGLWVSVRLCWLLPGVKPWLPGLLEMTFFWLVAIAFGRQVILAKNWRNAFFIAVFIALGAVNGVYAYYIQTKDAGAALHLLMSALFLIVHVVLVVGGRVIPFFTDRGLPRDATHKPAWLELSALLASLFFLLVYVLKLSADLLQAAAWAVVCFNVIRWLTWKPWQTAGKPILWSLHVAYGFVVVGFACLAAGLPNTVGIHVMAIGGFGLMILAMISRVSLGHSGRPLVLPNGFFVAYLALVFAVFFRVAAYFFTDLYWLLLWGSFACWCVGFGLFIWRYVPILFSARVDGRPG